MKPRDLVEPSSELVVAVIAIIGLVGAIVWFIATGCQVMP